mgnify:CR=1 FL=1
MSTTTFHRRLTRALREARDLRHRREESLLAAMVRAHAAQRYDDLKLLCEQLRPIYRVRIEPIPQSATEDETADA